MRGGGGEGGGGGKTPGRRLGSPATHRPHLTALTMEAKLSSMITMSDASCRPESPPPYSGRRRPHAARSRRSGAPKARTSQNEGALAARTRVERRRLEARRGTEEAGVAIR